MCIATIKKEANVSGSHRADEFNSTIHKTILLSGR